MVLQELEDRLYTSTEVANILGVSLRSVYRYLEDGKLDAEMKTATGRHRFTKQNIIDFMSPQIREPKPVEKKVTAKVEEPEIITSSEAVEEKVVRKEPIAEVVVEETVVEVETESVSEDGEEVDWLTKFRQAAEKYRTEQVDSEATPSEEKKQAPMESVSGLTDESQKEEIIEEGSSNLHFYKSSSGGLKDIAQNIDKSARKASLDYAFTLDAGLSLHKPIRPFSVIHAYVRSEDLAFFEKILNLAAVSESDAQLCLIVSDDSTVYTSKKEVHGLNVVNDSLLKEDLAKFGRNDLLSEME